MGRAARRGRVRGLCRVEMPGTGCRAGVAGQAGRTASGRGDRRVAQDARQGGAAGTGVAAGARAGDGAGDDVGLRRLWRSEEHTSELQSLMRISYAVFCLKKKRNMITLTTI